MNSRLDVLLKIDRKIFHTQDLALLWEISNRNTLYTTIKRYVQKGILIPIQKGLYATISLEKLNPQKLGLSLVHNYTYISTETVLFEEGVILQVPECITLVSAKSMKISLGGQNYLVRKMQDKFLYQNEGVVEKNGFRKTTLERAIADMLYFNPRYYFDKKDFINWKKVAEIQKRVGFK